MSAGPTNRSDLPAWLGEGPERCTFCLQGYSLEVEVRCAACDRAGCPHCLVRIRGTAEVRCPECARAEAAPAGKRG